MKILRTGKFKHCRWPEEVAIVPTLSDANDLADVLVRVRHWPESARLELASKILQSVEQDRDKPTQQRTFADLIGLWDTHQAPPTDEELARILEEERLKKYT